MNHLFFRSGEFLTPNLFMTMKTKVLAALMSFALSAVLHSYLTMKHYPLHLGFSSGDSVCNVSARFNCDAVTASSYSQVFGLPISILGGTYNLMLLLITLFAWWGWRGDVKTGLRESLWLSGGSLIASLVMGFISLFLINNYCLFCLGTYFLSLFGFVGLYASVAEDKPFRHLSADIKLWFSEKKGVWGFILFVPAAALFIHTAILQNYGADQLDQVVQTALSDWNNAPTQTFTSTPSLVKGASPEKAKMILTEFADFLCGHCKMAAPSIAAFVNSHSDQVRLIFYSFPLDSFCNSEIKQGNGVPCFLAEAVYCAERQNKGWNLHELIYTKQTHFYKANNGTEAHNLLKELSREINLNWETLDVCLNDPNTKQIIKNQAVQGKAVDIQGTPSFFVNGKKLERGQLLPVLNAVLNKIK